MSEYTCKNCGIVEGTPVGIRRVSDSDNIAECKKCGQTVDSYVVTSDDINSLPNSIASKILAEMFDC